MKASFIAVFAYVSILLNQIPVLNCNPFSESLDDSIKESILARGKMLKVINGTRTSRDDYPFMVSLQYHFGAGILFHFCAASIFDRNHVITAAHCVENFAPENVILRFGEWKRDENEPGEALRDPDAIFVHPQYNSSTLENHFAIITLNKTLEFTDSIQPIFSTVQAVVPGEKAYVMGLGDTRGTEDYNFLKVI